MTPEMDVVAYCPRQRASGRANPKHVVGDYHLAAVVPGGGWCALAMCGISISFLSRAGARRWRLAPDGQAATCANCIAAGTAVVELAGRRRQFPAPTPGGGGGV